ncbi:MAG: hypothetical protein OXH99_23305 [Bryobacterales bacterium]|nr:hypothetical protein [Bryobacterales bacterium]
MFICRIRISSHGGKTYFTYRLVRSRRIGAKVRQRTLLNLGSRFPIRRAHWQTLSKRVEQILDHPPALLPSEAPPAFEAEAQRIAERLLRDGVLLHQPAYGPGRRRRRPARPTSRAPTWIRCSWRGPAASAWSTSRCGPPSNPACRTCCRNWA